MTRDGIIEMGDIDKGLSALWLGSTIVNQKGASDVLG